MAKFDLTGVEFVKKAEVVSPLTGPWVPGGDDDLECQATVKNMLADIQARGEEGALEWAKKLDGFTGTALMTKEEVDEQTKDVPCQNKEDIEFLVDQVSRFAADTKSHIKDWSVDMGHGSRAGTKVLPVNTAGCYIPGGLYGYVASAAMTVATARVAGVKNIIAACPTNKKTGKIHPATLYTLKYAGATHILALGGIQGIAALAFGLFTGLEADLIVGPGNKFVAEAKRQLFGRCGIDQVAGPTEIGILADGSADPKIIATDLVSQAEHGPTSPAWLVTTCPKLAKEVNTLTEELAAKLDKDLPGGSPVVTSWPKYGEIVVVKSKEEAIRVMERYAPEHLEILTAEEDIDFYHQNLTNYGSIFLGEGSTVTHGDKATGPNHVLPTRRVSRYTGGLSVEKFMKKLTWQKLTPESNRSIGLKAARIARMEGMEGHARASDVRLEKYYPGEKFALHPQ